MSYQMPVSMGIIQSSGDTKFTLRLNLISTWLIVMPLSFLAAFVWKWPVELVVVAVQCDQIFKGASNLPSVPKLSLDPQTDGLIFIVTQLL